MLQVYVYRDRDNNIIRYDAQGHCGFDYEGKDIICAASSVLLQVPIFGISEYCNIKIKPEISKGKLICLIPSVTDTLVWKQVQAILETMLIGLKKIKEQYPEHIKIKEKINKGANIYGGK